MDDNNNVVNQYGQDASNDDTEYENENDNDVDGDDGEVKLISVRFSNHRKFDDDRHHIVDDD